MSLIANGDMYIQIQNYIIIYDDIEREEGFKNIDIYMYVSMRVIISRETERGTQWLCYEREKESALFILRGKTEGCRG